MEEDGGKWIAEWKNNAVDVHSIFLHQLENDT
jgi:hypothetical protein